MRTRHPPKKNPNPPFCERTWNRHFIIGGICQNNKKKLRKRTNIKKDMSGRVNMVLWSERQHSRVWPWFVSVIWGFCSPVPKIITFLTAYAHPFLKPTHNPRRQQFLQRHKQLAENQGSEDVANASHSICDHAIVKKCETQTQKFYQKKNRKKFSIPKKKGGASGCIRSGMTMTNIQNVHRKRKLEPPILQSV